MGVPDIILSVKDGGKGTIEFCAGSTGLTAPVPVTPTALNALTEEDGTTPITEEDGTTVITNE